MTRHENDAWRRFDRLCDVAAEIARRSVVRESLEDALSASAAELLDLMQRAAKAGMGYDQREAIMRAWARAFADGWSRLDARRGELG